MQVGNVNRNEKLILGDSSFEAEDGQTDTTFSAANSVSKYWDRRLSTGLIWLRIVTIGGGCELQILVP